MIEKIVEFFYYFGSCVPCVVICYLPFMDRLKRPVRKIAVEAILACVVMSLLNMILHRSGIDSSGSLATLALFLPGAFYYRRTVREGIHSIIFMLFVSFHIGTIAAGMELAYLLLMDVESDADMQKLFVRLIAYFILGWVLHRFYTPRLRHISSRDMKGLWIVPIPFTLITIYYYANYYNGILTDTLFPVVFILLTILSMTVYGVLLRMVDGVTERARLETEAQRIAMEKEMTEHALAADNAALDRLNRMKSDLIAAVSHEARTPLAVLASYAGLVSMEMKDKGMDEQMAADLDTIAFEAEHVASLIDSMRKLSGNKENAAKRTILDVGEIIRQTARLYAHILERGNVKLITNIPNGLPPVFGSPEESTQVLFNLLQNAKNHTERGNVAVSAKAESGCVSVTVSDTGGGIKPELLPHLFERGMTGGKGTGLGLPICKDIIESHGGTILVESEYGNGTAVTFTLPAYKEGGADGQ